MVHYHLSNPVNADDSGFYALMRDFVKKNRGSTASTEDFFALASEHFAKSPIGQKYGLKDLNWFVAQWVHGTEMPRYRLEYSLRPNNEGGMLLTGSVEQEGVSPKWFMPLPIVIDYPDNKSAMGTVY